MASWRPWRLASALGPGQSDSGKWRWHQNAARPGCAVQLFRLGYQFSYPPARARRRPGGQGLAKSHPGESARPAFYDETKGDYPNGNLYNEFNPYRTGDYRNNASIDYNPTHYNFFNAAVAMNAAPPDYAQSIWAIFDAEAVAGAVAGHPAVCGSGRLLLQCQHAGRTRRRH